MGLISRFFTTALVLVSSASLAHDHQAHSHQQHAKSAAILKDVVIRAFIPGASSSVGYFTYHNQTTAPQTLVGAEVQGVGRVELHTHQHVDGVMKMRQLDKVTIAPTDSVTFESGGHHLMLFDPQENFKEGQKSALTLVFADGTKTQVATTIVGLTLKQSDNSHHHHH